MKKIILSILFSQSIAVLLACDCMKQNLVDAVSGSEFIATAKIIRIIPDSVNPEYKITTIALIDVYKGEQITTLRIHTSDNTSCQFDLPLQSTWLFFAKKYADGAFGFGSCSSSQQIEIQLDSLQYPMGPRRYRHSIEFKLKVLGYLHNKKINPSNPYDLSTHSERKLFEIFKGVNVTDKEFAIYQIKVGKDLGIQNVKALKNWGDVKLSSEFSAFLTTNLNIRGRNKQTNIPKSTKLIIIYYAYQQEDEYPSFISEWDL